MPARWAGSKGAVSHGPTSALWVSPNQAAAWDGRRAGCCGLLLQLTLSQDLQIHFFGDLKQAVGIHTMPHLPSPVFY